jgi:large subunit ribosomal protein L22
MEIASYIKYLRISSKKLKTIAREIVGLTSKEAINRLLFSGKKSGKLLIKAINTVVADASNNLKLDKDHLKIKKIEILKGPSFKRWQAVSRGMAHQIKKRTSHIKIVLEEVKLPK